MSRPVERKVIAGTLGAGAGTIVSDFVLWGIDELWFPGAQELPTPVAAFASFVVITGLAFLSGFMARHNLDELLDYDEQEHEEFLDEEDKPIV